MLTDTDGAEPDSVEAGDTTETDEPDVSMDQEYLARNFPEGYLLATRSLRRLVPPVSSIYRWSRANAFVVRTILHGGQERFLGFMLSVPVLIALFLCFGWLDDDDPRSTFRVVQILAFLSCTVISSLVVSRMLPTTRQSLAVLRSAPLPARAFILGSFSAVLTRCWPVLVPAVAVHLLPFADQWPHPAAIPGLLLLLLSLAAVVLIMLLIATRVAGITQRMIVSLVVLVVLALPAILVPDSEGLLRLHAAQVWIGQLAEPLRLWWSALVSAVFAFGVGVVLVWVLPRWARSAN